MLDEEVILDITNSITEDMLSGATKKELIECVRYWSRKCSEEAGKRAALESRLELVRIAMR